MEKKRKKKTKKPQGRKVKLSDGTVLNINDNLKKQAVKKVYTVPSKDPEEFLDEPDDEYSKLKYPPPKKDPVFRKKWGRFIDSVVSRSNFNPGHLDALEVLCDLYVELEELSKFLRMHGRSFKVITVMGEVWRQYPQVAERNKVRAQIQQYSKNLDLFPKKEKSLGTNDPAEDEEWD